MKKNQGRWLLEEVDENTTAVTYELEMAFPMLVPSAVVSKLQQNSLPKLMAQYKTRAESLHK
jgi:ribosome-associated toxin RatA of RatAB toxin-antitoxin module